MLLLRLIGPGTKAVLACLDDHLVLSVLEEKEKQSAALKIKIIAISLLLKIIRSAVSTRALLMTADLTRVERKIDLVFDSLSLNI